MKLIALPKSPFFGANVHTGFDAKGHKTYSKQSLKVRRDGSDHGGDVAAAKREAEVRAQALQVIANEAMATDRAKIERKDFESMLESLLKACGKSVVADAMWREYSVQALAEYHRLSPPKSNSTKTGREGVIERFTEWLATDRAVRDIDRHVLQDFFDSQIEEVSAGTLKNYRKALKIVIDRAVDDGFLDADPLKLVVLPAVKSRSKEDFTFEEVAAIAGVLKSGAVEFADEWLVVVAIAATMGTREGDIVSLSTSDFVDEDGSVIIRFFQGKTEGVVSVALPRWLADLVRPRLALNRDLFPNLLACKIDSDRSRKGRGLGARFLEIMERAGIEFTEEASDKARGNLWRSHGFHSYRASAATLLEAAGVPEHDRMRLLGHTSTAIHRKYTKTKATTLAASIEKSGVWGELEKSFS